MSDTLTLAILLSQLTAKKLVKNTMQEIEESCDRLQIYPWLYSVL